MPLFLVKVKEIRPAECIYSVEAETSEEAVEKVSNVDGIYCEKSEVLSRKNKSAFKLMWVKELPDRSNTRSNFTDEELA